MVADKVGEEIHPMRTSTGARPPCEGADRRPGWSTARAGYHDPPSRADKNGLRRARHSVRTQGQRRRVGQGDSTCDRPSQTLSTMAMSHSTPAGLWGGNRVNRGGSRHDREGIHTRGAASRDMPCAQPCTVTRRAGLKAVPCTPSTNARGYDFQSPGCRNLSDCQSLSECVGLSDVGSVGLSNSCQILSE